MRTKLGLTESELMAKPWIALQIEMADFPYYKPSEKQGGKKVTTIDDQDNPLAKYKKP